jgi:predicted site-specific integrase-resolvase
VSAQNFYAMSQLLTATQFCEKMQISKVSLWRWERQGIIKPVVLGGVKRYPEKILTDLENQISTPQKVTENV